MKNLIKSLRDLSTVSVEIRGRSYPITKDGTGDIPVFSLGIGSHLQMTLSEEVKKCVTLYAADLYWLAQDRVQAPESLTIDTPLVADLKEALSQLGLKKPLLAGFSCFGILALELAKRMESEISGVVLVSTPPMWNAEVIDKAQRHFEEVASPDRKANDVRRKSDFEKIRKPNESLASVAAYEADAARYWKDYSLTHEFFEKLWEGIQVDDAIINHFFKKLLPSHVLEKGIESLTTPVVLLAGRLDFDSIPLLLWEHFPKPMDFTVIDCGECGHWPQLENRSVFDKGLLTWLRRSAS